MRRCMCDTRYVGVRFALTRYVGVWLNGLRLLRLLRLLLCACQHEVCDWACVCVVGEVCKVYARGGHYKQDCCDERVVCEQRDVGAALYANDRGAVYCDDEHGDYN